MTLGEGMVLRHVAALFALVLSIGFTFTALAQEEALETAPEEEAAVEEAAAAPEAKPSGPRLDEIIVTAQKRAEDVQDVPLSVTAIGGETLKEKNIGDLASVGEYTPNMTITNTPTFNFITMRGLGSGWNRGFEQSVAIVIDEVFYGRPSYLSNGQLDLSSIEVLRGPQGTLFGKNAVAGALHLRTAKPTNEWAVDADGTYGSENFRRVRGVVGGPLFSEDLSFRISFLDEERDGDIFNTLLKVDENQINNQSGRAKFLWDDGGKFNVLLSINGGTLRQDGSGAQSTLTKPRYQAAFEVFDPNFNDKIDGFTSKDIRDYVDREYWDTTLHAEYEVGEALLSSISNYAWFDEDVYIDPDYAPMKALDLDNSEDYRQFSQEFRITSGPGEWEYIAGLYAYLTDIYATYSYATYIDVADAVALTGVLLLDQCNNSDLGLDAEQYRQCRDAVQNDAVSGRLAGESIQAKQLLTGGAAQESSNRVFDQQTDSFAAFGQVNWNWREDIVFTFGARVSYEEKTLHIEHHLINNTTGQEGNVIIQDPEDGSYSQGSQPVGGAMTLQLFTPGIEEFTADKERTEFDISPKFSVQYIPNDDMMYYFTYGRGFKSGGFNAQPNRPDNIEFEEETSDTYEVGVKSEWLDGAARANVSVFYTSFKGLQIAAFNGVEFVVDNAADATIKGVEWEGMLAPMEGLLLAASGAYTDAKYDSFPVGPCQVDKQGLRICDLSGGVLPAAPKWQHTLSATWDRELFNWGFNLHAGVDGLFEGENYINTDLDERTKKDGSWMLRARIGVHADDGRWSLMMFGDNLTDRDNRVVENDSPAQYEAFFGIVEPGRSFEVQGRFVF